MKARSQFEPKKRARRRALQALYQWQMTRQDAAEIIEQFLEEQDFDGVDTGLFCTLVEGVVDSQQNLDENIQPFLDRPVAQLDVMETAILRIAAFELLNHSNVPYQVVLDEAISLARKFGADQSHTFINSVLDKAARQWRMPELTGTPAEPA